jgi:hypothetical protein
MKLKHILLTLLPTHQLQSTTQPTDLTTKVIHINIQLYKTHTPMNLQNQQ